MHLGSQARQTANRRQAADVLVDVPRDVAATAESMRATLRRGGGQWIGRIEDTRFEVGPADPWAPALEGELEAIPGGTRVTATFVRSRIRRRVRRLAAGTLGGCAAIGFVLALDATGVTLLGVVRAVCLVGAAVGIGAVTLETVERLLAARIRSRDRSVALSFLAAVHAAEHADGPRCGADARLSL